MDSDRSGSLSPSTASRSAESEASSASSTQEMNEIKHAIADYLDAAADGSFATSGSLPDATNPGLLLKGVGKIGLPLSERDAKAIINISRGTPSGESTKEDINQSERKTWGVEADRVEFRNPRWSKTVQYAVIKSVEQLGVLGGESSVRADLHKMLLYEGGGSPSAEHDSYAVSGTFGTLAIILPSEHEGGEAIVRLGNQTRTLSFTEPREFSYSYMAWYADAGYSVEPVSSGYRLVLTYSLVHRTGDIKAARPSSVLHDNRAAIDSALNAWKTRLGDGETTTDMLVHLFDCDYPQGKLGLQALEGSDQSQSLRLHEACQEQGFSTFLGQLEHTNRRNGYDEEDKEERDQDWTLTKLFTLEGVCMAETLDVEHDSIIQDQPFENEPPDDEQCDDSYEEGAEVTEIYKRSCVVIVPSDHLDALLRKASKLNISDWTQALLDRIVDEGSVEDVKDEVLKICSLSTDRKPLLSSDIESLVRAALKLNMPSVMISAFEGSQWGLTPNAIHDFARAMASRDVTPWLAAIATGIGSMRRLKSRLDAIELYQNEYETAIDLQKEPAKPKEKERQETEDLNRCLAESVAKRHSGGSLQIIDGDEELLIQTARSRGESFVSDVMLPLCKLVIRNTDFIANICTTLSEEASQQWLSAANVRSFTGDIVDFLARELSDHCALQAANESKTACFQPTQYSAYTMVMLSISTDSYHTRLSWRAISTLLCLCEKLELYDPVSKLLQPMIEFAGSAGVGDHTEFLIPLLQSLSHDLAESPHSLKYYQSLFQEVLLSYTKDYVGLKPTPPKDWSRAKTKGKCIPPLSHSTFSRNNGICDDCSALNEFLAAPGRSEWRLKAAERRRKHIDHQQYGLDFQTSLDKSEKPFTLIVSKTDESYRSTLTSWHGKRRSLISAFDDIGPEKLKIMLADRSDALMELYSDVTSEKDIAPARQALGSLSEPLQNKKRGRESPEDVPAKRAKQAQIIDLTEA